jgi:polysaccharide pyruvyl transferase WcaK-like protein
LGTPRRKIKIGLLGHYFDDENLGGIALSIGNMRLIDDAAASLGQEIEYIIFVNEKQGTPRLTITGNDYEYRRYLSCKQTLRHPARMLASRLFGDCDIVFNICVGDGFTDLYGFGRTLAETYMTFLAHGQCNYVVLAPQTIGPFSTIPGKIVGKRAMDCCTMIFARDSQSMRLCQSMGFAGCSREVVDVAFALPYTKTQQSSGQTNVGVNVSGLLYRGGYDHRNYFHLSFSYRDYVEELIGRLADTGRQVHLIAHVTSKMGSIEDDYTACEELGKEFPGVVVAPRFVSPVEAKGYIAGMDFFTGARMHATIAAFSSGVPVVPVAYSRKVNGLFGETLKYPYFIDAKGDCTGAGAVEKTIEYLGQLPVLKAALENGKRIYEDRLEQYRGCVAELIRQSGEEERYGREHP